MTYENRFDLGEYDNNDQETMGRLVEDALTIVPQCRDTYIETTARLLEGPREVLTSEGADMLPVLSDQPVLAVRISARDLITYDKTAADTLNIKPQDVVTVGAAEDCLTKYGNEIEYNPASLQVRVETMADADLKWHAVNLMLDRQAGQAGADKIEEQTEIVADTEDIEGGAMPLLEFEPEMIALEAMFHDPGIAVTPDDIAKLNEAGNAPQHVSAKEIEAIRSLVSMLRDSYTYPMAS